MIPIILLEIKNMDKLYVDNNMNKDPDDIGLIDEVVDDDHINQRVPATLPLQIQNPQTRRSTSRE